MGTMNEFEARQAALTAAVTWCSTPDGSVTTDAMLEYAGQFETWLLRPAVPVVVEPDSMCTLCEHAPHSARACPMCSCGYLCVCLFRSKDTACSSCGHDAHDPGTCASTQRYTQPATAVLIPHDPYMDGPEPPDACALCGHDVHGWASCSPRCACRGGRL